MKGSKFGGKDVKSGGRFTQKSAGTSPSGRPSDKVGGGSRGEMSCDHAGTMPSGSPDKRFSNRSGGEFSQASAGK